MEKEKLLNAIKAQLGNTSLSDRTISEYVDAIIPTVGDKTLEDLGDAFFASHKSILKSLEGNLNKETAERVNTFKTQWEKDHKTTPDTPSVNPPSNDDKYDALMKEIQALKDARNEDSKANKATNLRNGVLGKSDELKVSNKAIWNDVCASLSVSDDSTAETLLASAKTAYETKLKSYLGDGAMPYGGTQSPQVDEQQTKKELDDYFKGKWS